MPGARSCKRVYFGGKCLDVVSGGPVGALADGVAQRAGGTRRARRPLSGNGGVDGTLIATDASRRSPPRITLPRSPICRIERGTRREPEYGAHLDRILGDTPFYARSVIRTRLLARKVHLIHESLSLDCFSSGWVRAMLLFRMPRVIW